MWEAGGTWSLPGRTHRRSRRHIWIAAEEGPSATRPQTRHIKRDNIYTHVTDQFSSQVHAKTPSSRAPHPPPTHATPNIQFYRDATTPRPPARSVPSTGRGPRTSLRGKRQGSYGGGGWPRGPPQSVVMFPVAQESRGPSVVRREPEMSLIAVVRGACLSVVGGTPSRRRVSEEKERK